MKLAHMLIFVVVVSSAALAVNAISPFLHVQVTTGAEMTSETSSDSDTVSFSYVGANKCKLCHKKESEGAQYTIWENSGHSKAFETLATPEAAEFAKERGIEGSPQEAEECLKCHSTAYALTPEELEASKITVEEGVSCESCHGAGSGYYKKATMQSIADGELDGLSVGLVMPTEEVCVTCHNEESPAYVEFDFETFYEKIAHPRPEGDE